MSGLTTQERAQLRALDHTRRNGAGRMDEETFYVTEPVRRVGRRVIRPGQVVSTVIACGSAETVTFTTSRGEDSHKGFEVAVVHGPPSDAAAQHRRIVDEALARAAATARGPRPGAVPSQRPAARP